MKTGKKRFIGVFASMFLLVFAAACVFGACGSKEKEATVESVSVSPTSLELTLDSSGEASGTVTATVKMSDSSNYTGDITVGAVLGVSYAVSPMSGSSATITVTATEPVSATSVSVSAGGKSASFTLTVNAYEAGTPEPEPEPGTEENYAVSVAAESSVTEVEVESTLQLTASVTNNGTAVEGVIVTWSQSSDDGGEVSFDETTPGLITGVTAGTVTITATYTPEGGTAVSGSITVTVKAVTSEPGSGTEDSYAVTVTSENGVTEVEVEGSIQLTASVTNDGTAVEGASVTWSQSSDDGGEVEFSETTPGLITGKTAGTVTITATYTPEGGEAVSGTITITVREVDSQETEHTHVYGSPEWTWNDDYTCTVTWTCTTEGCEEDGNTVTRDATVTPATTGATCTTDGQTVYTATYTASDGTVYTCTETKTVTIPATGHTYPAATQTEYFVWPTSMESVTENSTISITVKCSVCGNDIETVTATITNIETTDATSDTNGKTVYTATAELNGSEVELSYEVTIPATGHSYPEATDTTYVVWDWENKTENTVTVTIYCKDGDEHVMETGTVTFTTEVTKEPSCTGNGVLTYTASFTATGNGVTYTSTYGEDIDMTAHTAGTSTVFSDGSWYVACSVCGGACDDPLTTGEGYTFNVTTAEEIKAAAALNGAKIILADNITATVEISGTVSIDLSGYTLTGSGAHTITVKAGGVLTIEDTQESGVVDNVSTGCAAVFVEAGGEAKLVGGTYTRSLENGDGGTYYTIVNQGTMTISSPVEVKTSAATTSSMIENGWATPTDNTTGATATLTIDGGTFSGGANHLIKNDDYGKLVISGGTFTGSGVSVVLNYGELEISNGTFTQENTTNNSLVIWNNNGGVAYPTATISGGTFVGGEYETLYNDSTGTMKISGGTFENFLYAVVYSAGTLEISGGTFKSTGTGLYIYVIWAEDGTVNITNGTFTAGDSSDVLVAAGGTAEVTISGGTFTGPDGATMLYTYKKESEEEITATITVTGGSFSAAPEGFLADGYAATYDETAGLFVVAKAPAYVADAAISDTEITLDLANGEDQSGLTITVVMSEEGSDFEGHVTWTITSGSDVVKIDENGGLSATVTTLGVTGEATITAEIDGTEYKFEIKVTVIDSTAVAEGLPTAKLDFSDSSTYSWISTNSPVSGTDVSLAAETYTDNGILTLVGSTKMSLKYNSGNVGLSTGAEAGSSYGYFSVDVSAYQGKTISVSVVMSNTGSSNGIRSLILATSLTTAASDSTVLALVSSEANGSGHQTLSYVGQIPADCETLYITWTDSIYIYSISVKEATDETSAPAVDGVTIQEKDTGLTFTYDEKNTDENDNVILETGSLTAVVTLTAGGTYGEGQTWTNGGYLWTSSNEKVVTVSGTGATATVTVAGVGEATITVRLWTDPSKTAECKVVVNEKEYDYTATIVLNPTSLELEKGNTGTFTFSVTVVAKDGAEFTGYSVNIESKDTTVALDSWDSVSDTVSVTAVAKGSTVIIVTVSVDGVEIAKAECSVKVNDSSVETQAVTVTITFSFDGTAYSNGVPNAVMTYSVEVTDEYKAAVTYTYTSSYNTSKKYIYDGTTYSSITSAQLKASSDRQLKIEIPEEAENVSILCVLYTDSTDAVCYISTDTSSTSGDAVLGTLTTNNSCGEKTYIVEASGLDGGTYYVYSNSSGIYTCGGTISYTVYI